MTHILNDMEIEKVKEEMCDNYCRYPMEPNVDMDVICGNCPMNKLEEGHDVI